ncbi:hypothetical protein QFC19_004160 [Naganishia cerealis]|uniref:Uncharacterized protein n=1 Tax=Naganishia cerealis TaxID=610337 RepID=A0ACC2VZ02_9TREE|nr:hypothetical protein QFC19_004160 [Naganishia cerealis]
MGLSGTSVTDAGHKVLQAISAETNNRYLKATRLHTELALAERPTTTVRKGAVQDRIYKGYHRLWPEAVGWEGSPEFPSYRVHVIGDPAAVKPVMRTKANGVQRESGPVMGIDAVPAAPQLFPLISQCPIYSAPGFTVVDSSTFQHSNERSKRFVSTGAPPSRRKRRAVTDDKPPQGVARQTVLSGMLIRDAIDEKQLSADTVRKNLMATIINEKKVKAKLAAAATAAAPSVPPKVGGFFSASRSAQSQEVDISKSHLPATKAGHLDRRYGNRAQYLAKPAMTSALSGCPSLISSQSTMSTSAQTSPTTQSQELYVSSTPITSSIPSTPCKTGPSKPLGRLASASLSLDPVEARPSKKATGYGMFRKK